MTLGIMTFPTYFRECLTGNTCHVQIVERGRPKQLLVKKIDPEENNGYNARCLDTGLLYDLDSKTPTNPNE